MTDQKAPKEEGKAIDLMRALESSEEEEQSLTDLEHKYVFWVTMRAQQDRRAAAGAPQSDWENEIKAVAKFKTVIGFYNICVG